MLNWFKSVKASIHEADMTVMFWLGYALASIISAGFFFTLAVIVSVGKALNIEVCREVYTDLMQHSNESFGRFLNNIQVVLPDKVRESLTYRTECW